MDYHNTADVEADQKCTVDALNRLVTEFGIEVAIVSSAPTSVPKHYNQMGLDKQVYQNTRILEENQSPLLISRSDDKVARITRELKGRCIIGIVGEEPEVEGWTAQLLKIPYFAIYVKDKVTGKHWGKREINICKLIGEPIGAQKLELGRRLRSTLKKCPRGYEMVTEQIEDWIPETEPSLDMNKFAPGSFYAKNWCELSAHIAGRLASPPVVPGATR